MVVTAACAHPQPKLHTGVTVEPVPEPCFDSLATEGTLVSIANGTNGRVSFSVFGASGPPFGLHPWVFEIVEAETTTHDYSQWHIVLEDYFPPDHEVSLGAGDKAQFLAHTGRWPAANYPGKIRLQVKDTNGHTYESSAVPVCPAPNNSLGDFPSTAGA